MGNVGLQEDKDCHLAVCTPGVHLQEAVRELIDPRSALLPGGLPPSACAGIALFPSGGWLTASTTQGISHHFTLAVRGPGRDSPLQTGGEGGGEGGGGGGGAAFSNSCKGVSALKRLKRVRMKVVRSFKRLLLSLS